MRLGLGLSTDSPPPRLLRSFNAAHVANLSTGLLTLPGWLAISCATTGRTVRTGVNTIVSGLGANAARARSVDGTNVGLAVEMARTNFILWSEQADHAGWTTTTNATVTANSVAAPDSNTTADTLDYTGGGTAGLYRLFDAGHIYANTTKFVISSWIKLASGTPTIRMDNGYSQPSVSPTSAWVRYENSGTSDGANSAQLLYRSPVGSTTAFHIYVFGAQSEVGLYPNSYIPTTSASATRAQDVLTMAAASLAPGGYFNLDFTMGLHYTQAENAADHDLVYFDANNRIYVKQSDQTIRLRLGGSDTASGALTWARDDAIRIQAQHRKLGKKIVVLKNGVSVYDSGLLSPASAISLPASAAFLGNGTTTQESGDMRILEVFRP